ncbi:MAG: septum formation protein Maf [Proteobacteria bacterium]|nr:septum formation protein Maf [Pseudomonadota bacterium]
MNFHQNREIVLASGSPRRKRYLELFGFQFRIVTGSVDESAGADELPLNFARRMAKEKAEAVMEQCSREEIIIAADTIVVFGNRILGKPKSPEDVYPMLEKLNGKTHQVITSYVVLDGLNRDVIRNEAVSKVSFNRLSKNLLKAYAGTKEPLDKAGAYSIQGIGTFLVRSIEGSYNNVVGLPIEMLLQDLLERNYISLQIPFKDEKSYNEKKL